MGGGATTGARGAVVEGGGPKGLGGGALGGGPKGEGADVATTLLPDEELP